MNLAVMKRGLIKLDSAPYKIMIEPIKLSAKFSLAAMQKPEATEIIAFRGAGFLVKNIDSPTA